MLIYFPDVSRELYERGAQRRYVFLHTKTESLLFLATNNVLTSAENRISSCCFIRINYNPPR